MSWDALATSCHQRFGGQIRSGCCLSSSCKVPCARHQLSAPWGSRLIASSHHHLPPGPWRLGALAGLCEPTGQAMSRCQQGPRVFLCWSRLGQPFKAPNYEPGAGGEAAEYNAGTLWPGTFWSRSLLQCVDWIFHFNALPIRKLVSTFWHILCLSRHLIFDLWCLMFDLWCLMFVGKIVSKWW